MRNGVIKNGQLYNDRFNILHKIYQQQELKQPMKWNDEDTNKVNTISRVIYCEDNVSALWNKLFQNDPSLIENITCTTPECVDFQNKRPTLSVNYEILLKNGIQDLQNALIYHGTFQSICTFCKNKTRICEQKLNSYIYIELDIKLRNQDSSMLYRLRDFPTFLNIKENETKNIRYRLCGLIGYNAHHYIAYCRRLCGDWRFYNDLMKESKPIGKHTKILPHGVLYILEK
ncbi:uncharacterized protein LOC141532108 [Cotesia typhae]|uniref:uncharacterized protein LOC141532108 n=1 Tax=Cotesia typhae TaxID=2053667 RepID=UPI003D6952E5